MAIKRQIQDHRKTKIAEPGFFKGTLSESDQIRNELRSVADSAKAAVLARFFKTGPGEYGEGDRFIGVVVPEIRKIARSHLQAREAEIRKLLRSPYHEERLTALLILVEQYRRGDASRRESIYRLYLASTSRINNWDLVDLTAPHIIGAQLEMKSTSVLTTLARSKSLWERRIAMLSTYYFIRRGESGEALRIAELLLHDPHDLIHKAVGWMLREVGKRCSRNEECRFLDQHAYAMPRTMLRYAIEHFPEALRTKYMRSAGGSRQ
jgi:3-methyladenine DNA glycosylase AlkD